MHCKINISVCFAVAAVLIQGNSLIAEETTEAGIKDAVKKCIQSASEVGSNPTSSNDDEKQIVDTETVGTEENDKKEALIKNAVDVCETACQLRCNSTILGTLSNLYLAKAKLYPDEHYLAIQAMQVRQCALSAGHEDNQELDDIGDISVGIGLLQIVGDIKGAELTVDNNDVGPICRSRIAMDVGTHDVVVKRKGKVILTDKITLVGDDKEKPLDIPAARRPLLKPSIGIGVTGLVAVGVGAGFGFSALNKAKDLDQACPDNLCPPWSNDDIADYKTSRIVADTFLWSGVSLFSVGAALLFVDIVRNARNQKSEVPFCIRPWVSANDLQLSLTGAF